MAEGKEMEVYKPIDLQSRLKEEQDMLEKYFWPEEFPTLDMNNEHCFERTVQLRSDRIYKLRVYVNSQYPDSLPDLIVCDSPEPMPNWSGSHDTHTLSPKDRFLRICHWHWACWTRKYMIYHVFNKGEEWLEAYEKYRENGILPLDLKQMQLTEEEEMKVKIHQQRTALTLYQDPNFLRSELFRWHFNAMFREILSQSFQITDNNRRIIQQRMLGSAVQRINQVPFIVGRLAQVFGTQCSVSESQHLPITDDEIRIALQKVVESALQRTNHEPTIICIAPPCMLKYEITQCKLANPGCTVDVSFTETFGQFNITVKPIPPQN